MSIGARLKQWREYKNLKQDEASSLLRVPFSTFQKYEMDIRKPGAEAIEAFVDAGINANWLLKGEGDMLLNGDKAQHPQRSGLDVFDVEERKPAYLGHSQQAYNDRMGMSAANLDDFALVPFYDVEASAGHGSHVDLEAQKSEMAFRKNWLNQRGLQISKCVLIKARGDSMEPTIFHGDILLVDTSIESIKDDAIYIVQSDHHLIVKRIQQSLDGSLTIISDNKRYKEQTVSPEQAKEIKIAGRVRWYGHEI